MQISHIDDNEIVTKTQQKIKQIETEFQQLHNEIDNQIIQENSEVIERIITKALYQKYFFKKKLNLLKKKKRLIQACRIKYDRKIEFYCRVYDFLTPKNFQIQNEQIQDDINFVKAKQQIQNIDFYQTPRDKLTCIVNACKFMSSIISNSSKNKPTGADDVIPGMMYLIIQSLPARPLTNLQYIQSLRNDQYLKDEEFYFTMYASSIELIENLKINDLEHISEKEFNDSFRNNYKKYQSFLDAVDIEEEQIKRQNIFKLVQKLQTEMGNFHSSFENNQIKFHNKPFSQIQLGDMQELYNEYHILHKNIIDHQIDLQNQINFLDKYINQGNVNNQTKRFFGLF
ncbi:vacuolar sorting protein, putative [Ichthyophthirius multifiliis]|uniref:Vacuolar sorting protein, putative n=1 Tax=Ichthyophthirius multifiliis TaxID=5932 RepID=G0R1W3_ICHMU|nr:vacuolar sorting protein, putative [Ichthyophthirius multifiliis]EGR28536.1 vacuolar sorting protein, putative [Ichthyophthirius multifiliis]|eukprot:XP_004029772.1 vacuolar sorting protein, putative [Ichthyophthirius multifiliis]